MVTALNHPLKLLCTLTACVAILASCGGTHGRIGSVWINLPADSVVAILTLNEIVPIQPIDTLYPIQPMHADYGGSRSTYFTMPVTAFSQDIDTIQLHVTIDILHDGVTGCYLSLIGYKPKGINRYCWRDECSSEQNEAALRVFEAVILQPLREYIRFGELET